jgi:chromosome segregation ATPase
VHGYYPGEPRLRARAELTSASGGELPGSRVEALEQMVRTLRNEIADERKILSGVLHDLQREIMAQREDTARFGGTHDKAQSVFSDRLQSFDESIVGGRASAGADMSLLHDRIGALERAVQTELSDTRSAIEAVAHRPDPANDMAPIENKLAIIEEAVLTHDTPQRLDALTARFSSFEQAHETDRAGAQEARSALSAEFGNLATAAEDRYTELTKDVASLTSTIEEHTRRAADGQTALSHEIGSIEDALGKVNDNQLTLAEQLGNLHKDVSKSVAASSDRLEALERTTMRTLETLEALSGTVGKIHDLAVEREYRRTRFWFWLFGTDDWIKASWPSQSARLAADLKRVKPIGHGRSTPGQ